MMDMNDIRNWDTLPPPPPHTHTNTIMKSGNVEKFS